MIKSSGKTLKSADDKQRRASSNLVSTDKTQTHASNDTSSLQQNHLGAISNVENLIGVELFALACCLFALIYLLEFANRSMTNFISKILGGERRRSVAASTSHSSGQQQQAQTSRTGQDDQQAQRYSSTLSLPRGSNEKQQQESSGSSNPIRRASRSSIHSVSALILGAFTGGQSSGSQQSKANGNAILCHST